MLGITIILIIGYCAIGTVAAIMGANRIEEPLDAGMWSAAMIMWPVTLPLAFCAYIISQATKFAREQKGWRPL